MSVVGSTFIPMSSTIHPTDATDFDVRTTLLDATTARKTADREEARLLALAIQIVHLFPVDEDTPVASFSDQCLTTRDENDPIRDHLAGAGTPMVAERAVEELAAALDISYRSGCNLVADALELNYRLPRLWRLVQDGKLQAWKARQVAQHTTHLGPEAVAFVDAQAAIAGAKNRIVPNLAGLVHAALIRFEPDTAKEHEQAAKDHRDVTFDHSGGETLGSTTMTATMDPIDAHDLDTTISEVANQLGRLGDTVLARPPPRPSPRRARPPPSSHRPVPAATRRRSRDQRTQPAHRADGLGHRQHHRRHHLPPHRRRRPPHRPERPGRRHRSRDGREARHRHPRPHQDLAAAHRRSHHQAGPRPLTLGRGRPARPTRVDARPRHVARRPLRLPRLQRRRPTLRPRPHHPVRADGRGRATQPNLTREFRLPVPTTSPVEDLHQLALRTRRPRPLRVDQPARPHHSARPISKQVLACLSARGLPVQSSNRVRDRRFGSTLVRSLRGGSASFCASCFADTACGRPSH